MLVYDSDRVACVRAGLVRSWDKEVTQRYELGDDIGSGSIGSVSTVTCKGRRCCLNCYAAMLDHDSRVPRLLSRLIDKRSATLLFHSDDDSGEPRMYALKTMISFEVTEEERKEFRNELQLLRKLDHPHIVQVHNLIFVKFMPRLCYLRCIAVNGAGSHSL